MPIKLHVVAYDCTITCDECGADILAAEQTDSFDLPTLAAVAKLHEDQSPSCSQ